MEDGALVVEEWRTMSVVSAVPLEEPGSKLTAAESFITWILWLLVSPLWLLSKFAVAIPCSLVRRPRPPPARILSEAPARSHLNGDEIAFAESCMAGEGGGSISRR